MVWWKSDEYCKVKPLPIDHHHTDYFNIHDWEMHNIAWVVAGFCAALSVLLSLIQTYKHCANYTVPSQQKHIIRIMLMVPVYAIDSFLSFRLYWLSVYFDVARDCYEAFVIYTFYSLLIEYVGGYHEGKEMFSKKDPFKLAIPLCCITIAPKRGLLRQCKRLTLQYVVIRPVTTILSLILHSFDEYCPGNFSPQHAYLYITFINFVSVTVAMYALVQFYSVSKEEIARFKPIPKFLAVKFVIFLSFWQAVCVSAFVSIHGIKATAHWSTENIATGVQNALMCVEMLIAAIWHYKAFDHHEFEEDYRTPVLRSAANSFNPYDIAQDVYYSFFPKKQFLNMKISLKKKIGKSARLLSKNGRGREKEREKVVENKRYSIMDTTQEEEEEELDGADVVHAEFPPLPPIPSPTPPSLPPPLDAEVHFDFPPLPPIPRVPPPVPPRIPPPPPSDEN